MAGLPASVIAPLRSCYYLLLFTAVRHAARRRCVSNECTASSLRAGCKLPAAFAKGASKFIPMAFSDVVDDDMVRHSRSRRAGTMIFGLNALVGSAVLVLWAMLFLTAGFLS